VAVAVVRRFDVSTLDSKPEMNWIPRTKHQTLSTNLTGTKSKTGSGCGYVVSEKFMASIDICLFD
jgi:hypothetical protein